MLFYVSILSAFDVKFEFLTNRVELSRIENMLNLTQVGLKM